ncbi:hypothetical protein ACVWWN_005353 [Mycobacterium sp. URHB0021]|jgi:hypothetical protein
MGIATTHLTAVEQTAFLTLVQHRPSRNHRDHPQTWNPRTRLIEETSLTHAPEVDLFPTLLRIATRLKSGARHGRTLRYAF